MFVVCCKITNRVIFLLFSYPLCGCFLVTLQSKKIIITKLYAIGNEEKRFSSGFGIDG